MDKDIENFTKKYETRLKRVFGASVQELAEEANEPVGKGGRMRVDTGFLRSSLKGQRNTMPSGAGEPTKGQTYSKTDSLDGAEESSLLAELLRWKAGDKFYLGWSANYARVREYKDGFVRYAAQRWEQIVKDNAKKLS